MAGPITLREFAAMLRKCKPPGGWPKTIAVANSGGPDSTCLLYLFKRISVTFPDEFPSQILSLTINHDLQRSAGSMSAHCASFAAQLGVEHRTRKIGWGKDGFPEKPSSAILEKVAREMRYALLFEEMVRAGSSTLALGHHLDDQVETSMMRIGMGSSVLGAAGMRPVRRWGMTLNMNSEESAVLQAMRMWQIRPFLEVGKDRILATCEAENLGYVTDKTNFQPEMTIRNAIRYIVSTQKTISVVNSAKLQRDLQAIEDALPTVVPGLSLRSGTDSLRTAVMSFTALKNDVEDQADAWLQSHRVPSAPGTFRLEFTENPSSSAPTDILVRKAIVERILRYVSPCAWGSIRAQGFGRTDSAARIAKHLWDERITSLTAPFTVGAQVLWRPFKESRKSPAGWLALRQPPPKKNIGLLLGEPFKPRVLGPMLKEAHSLWKSEQGPSFKEILWDHRFAIKFYLDRISEKEAERLFSSSGDLVVELGRGAVYQPCIVYNVGNEEEPEILHSHVVDVSEAEGGSPDCVLEGKQSEWIDIRYIRPLSRI
ncbi:tRNA-lysidine synthetase [Coprinopsis sp. MPI-PUGE-AT-0042]|nr:tRNA-lysidine synthetase [Coprinopsis sp. MPI-PUGE-AT-0042]